MNIFEWDEQTPVTANNMNEMQNILNDNVTNGFQKNGTILWTNPNPTADFAGSQDIILSSDDYDVLEVYFRSDTNGSRTVSTKFLKGYGCQVDMFSINVATKRWSRRLSYSSATKYISENAYLLEHSQTTTIHNEYCVPLYVIGYKTGLFN